MPAHRGIHLGYASEPWEDRLRSLDHCAVLDEVSVAGGCVESVYALQNVQEACRLVSADGERPTGYRDEAMHSKSGETSVS
jgi:hypothetical protein